MYHEYARVVGYIPLDTKNHSNLLSSFYIQRAQIMKGKTHNLAGQQMAASRKDID
jgi:hypothetical protein